MPISNKNFQFISFFILIAIVIGVAILNNDSGSSADKTLQTYADRVVQKCSSSVAKERCYDAEVPKFMKTDNLSLEDSFKVIGLVQKKVNGYWFCHIAGHQISANEYDRNPNNWRDIITRVPSGICSNGGLHGALQKHFSSETLTQSQIKDVLPDLNRVCEPRNNWKPTEQQRSSCYHELGHLSMYVTNANILASYNLCGQFGVKDDGRNYTQTCGEGIFMQVFEPREIDDFALIYQLVPEKEKLSACDQYEAGLQKGACWKIGWKNKYEQFCNQFQTDLRFACFREAWVVNDDKIQTAEGIVDYCGYSKEIAEKKKCFNKLIYALMAASDFDQEKVEKICVDLLDDIMGQCFAHVASRLIETDKKLISRSVGVCALAAEHGVVDVCYDELVYYAGFVFTPGSAEFNQLCSALPEKWKINCLARKN